MTEKAIELLFWHAENLKGLVDRMKPTDHGYETVLARYEECLRHIEEVQGG